MKVAGIIPARYASSRFPQKMLAVAGGKPLIQHTYENAIKCGALSSVIVAADHNEIISACENASVPCVRTSVDHPTGTSRVAEAANKIDADIIVNVQGDEPMIDEKIISDLVEAFKNESTDIATVVKATTSEKEANDENVVKAVVNKHGFAMYFSRAKIPFTRSNAKRNAERYFKHIGIYAYRKHILNEIVEKEICEYEEVEMLEQLRWLYEGYKVKVVETELSPFGIDTEAEFETFKHYVELEDKPSFAEYIKNV